MSKDFLEQNLEQIIAENTNTIQEKGFPFLFDCTKRQFRLPNGLIIDLISYQIDGKNITLRVFELKRKKISFDGLVQLYGYCLELYTLLFPYFENINIDKFLIGAEMDSSLQVTLSHVSDVEVYIYEYQLNGVNFRRFIPVWERTNDELLKDFKPTEKSAIFHQNIIDTYLDNIWDAVFKEKQDGGYKGIILTIKEMSEYYPTPEETMQMPQKSLTEIMAGLFQMQEDKRKREEEQDAKNKALWDKHYKPYGLEYRK